MCKNKCTSRVLNHASWKPSATNTKQTTSKGGVMLSRTRCVMAQGCVCLVWIRSSNMLCLCRDVTEPGAGSTRNMDCMCPNVCLAKWARCECTGEHNERPKRGAHMHRVVACTDSANKPPSPANSLAKHKQAAVFTWHSDSRVVRRVEQLRKPDAPFFGACPSPRGHTCSCPVWAARELARY